MPSDLLAGLNPEQLRAVTVKDGPLLVLAGAGTGKTRVITMRAAWLLSQGVRPEELLLVTFTNKAAREMRERLKSLVGKAADSMTCGTFHSFCIRLLREHHEAAGLPKTFGICDSSDQVSAIKGALRELRVAEQDVHPRAAQSAISLFKNSGIDPEGAMDRAADDHELTIARCFGKYEEHLRRSKVVDFDDFLLYTERLLREDEGLRTELARRHRYVMIDEYQDTNSPQYGIMHAIVRDHRNLCVVGDDDQSIYGWRGADIRRILDFEKDFPQATKVHLETNYRSTEEILDGANKVIRNNPKRHDKTLRSALGSGSSVPILRMDDETHEASYIATEIDMLVNDGDEHFRDIAILVRTAQQPRAFEAELRSAGIPYRLVGGMSFFDRKEVRDVMAYLRLVANPADETSFLRIVNTPARGIGKTTITKVLERATAEGSSAYPVFQRMVGDGEVGAAATKGFRALDEALQTIRNYAEQGDLVFTLRELLRVVDYRAEVDRIYPDDQTRDLRWNGVMEILDFAENHERKTGDSSPSSFLEALTLDENDRRDKEDDYDAVTLMTLHAAKGLEFRRVFLVGVEEGILPHGRSAADGGIEEERRLMYVGVTRAQHDLSISYCDARSKFGRLVTCHPSRFLFEMRELTPPDGWQPVADGISTRG